MKQSIVHMALVIRDYNEMVERGVRFVREPRTEPYGIVAVFEYLYGNLWDLMQLNNVQHEEEQ